MRAKNVILLVSIYALITTTIINTASKVSRAKTLVRGAKMYREQTLPELYDFLKSAGLGTLAKKLNNSIEYIKQVENAIEENLQQKLSSAEKKQRRTDQAFLERYQIFMNAKVLDEINKLFNTLDNITSNLGKEVRDYRKAQREFGPSIEAARQVVEGLSKQASLIKTKIKSLKEKVAPQLKEQKLKPNTAVYDKALIELVPEIAKLRTELTKHRELITQKNNVLVKLEGQLIPKLKDYFDRMKRDSEGLLKQAKRLGEKMNQKAGKEQDTVILYQKKLDQQEKNRADQALLREAIAARKRYEKTLSEIQSEVTKLSRSEQRLWGMLIDLYNRVLRTESIIMYGPYGIKKWTLPKILRIELPK